MFIGGNAQLARYVMVYPALNYPRYQSRIDPCETISHSFQ